MLDKIFGISVPRSEPSGEAVLEGRFFRFISRLSTLRGWRGALLTIFIGAIAASALPPAHFLPGLSAFSILAWRLERETSSAHAAWQGWLFGFGYHLVGLYWISNALLVESDKFAIFVPLAAVGLPMALSLFPAATFALIPRIAAPGWPRVLAVVALWSLAEFGRGHLFTGFPWNLPAYAFSISEALSQTASLVGAHGLSLLVLLASTSVAVMVGPHRNWSRNVGLCGVACVLIPLVAWLGGATRLALAPPAVDTSVVIRLVQGNIPQKDKWKPELRPRHIARYLDLSRGDSPSIRAHGLPDNALPTVVIWPETAVPGFLAQSRDLRHALAAVAPNAGSLVTGAPSIAQGPPRRLYNSLIGVGADGLVNARYDKVHLVPFGEYVPLKSWLPLPRVVESFADFTPGPERASLDIPGLGMVSPLICYEIIFPGAVVANQATNEMTDRPRALLNLTNDAWYGESSGPYQHLAISKMRAIEEGIPLIRAANTGISGIYDAYGRTLVQLALGETGTADAYLPLSSNRHTIYSRIGDCIYFIILIISFIGILINLILYNRKHLVGTPPNKG